MKVELKPWLVPNYVIAKMPPREKQDGFKNAPHWHLSEVDADTLVDQCNKFRAEIFRIANKPDPDKNTLT